MMPLDLHNFSLVAKITSLKALIMLRNNLETCTWESMPALPQHLRGMNVALLNESIYVLGGYVHNAAAQLDTVYMLDNNGTEWQQVANLLKPRFEANVTVFDYGCRNTTCRL
uniref:Kelch-like protein 5 n=1 Tax=Zeugodacus cucurbitae TaxID=28588 RepID=A0A0A1WM99_ZEUCU